MATERIDDISTEKLKKRKKFILVLVGIFIGVAIVWIGLICWDLIADKKIEAATITGLVAPLAMIWLPIFMLIKVNKELERRRDKEKTN
ncbi:hypothetical protein ACFLT1_08695 [Bacteroidota bacterium]